MKKKILQALKGLVDVKIYMPILSNLFTRVVNNHNYYAPVFKVADTETALQIEKEFANVQIEVQETVEVKEHTDEPK